MILLDLGNRNFILPSLEIFSLFPKCYAKHFSLTLVFPVVLALFCITRVRSPAPRAFSFFHGNIICLI